MRVPGKLCTWYFKSASLPKLGKIISELWDKNKHRVLQRKTAILKTCIRPRKKDSVTTQIWLKSS